MLRKSLTLLFLCLTSLCAAKAQLISQGNETIVNPQSGTATLAVNTSALNFSQTTGTNTFIMGGGPANAARVYITNNSANNCVGSFQITVATTAEKQITTFNGALQAWQIVPIINPSTGAYASNTGLLPIIAGTTTVITTAAVAGNNLAVIVNNTTGGCANVTLDVVVVLTPVAITSPLLSVASNGSIIQSQPTNVQGIIAQQSSGGGVFPVLIGGVQQPTNTTLVTLGIDAIRSQTIPGVPALTPGTYVENVVPPLAVPSELVLNFDAFSSDGGAGAGVALPFVCISNSNCSAGSQSWINVESYTNPIGGTSVTRKAINPTITQNLNDIVISLVPVSNVSGPPTVRQVSNNNSFFTTLAGSTLLLAATCTGTSVCTINTPTDTMSLTYRQVATINLNNANNNQTLTLFAAGPSTGGVDTVTINTTPGSLNGSIQFVEVVGTGAAALNTPAISASADQIGNMVFRLDAQGSNQFNCAVTISTLTTAQCQGTPAQINNQNVRAYVTDYQINTTAAGTTSTIQLVTGTGVNCATATANLSAIAPPNITVGLQTFSGFRTPLLAPTNTAVCVKQAGGGAGTSVVEVHGFFAP